MLSLKEIRAQVKALKLTVKNYREYSWDEWKYSLYSGDGDLIQFREDKSTFCCAVNEFGGFTMGSTLNKHWDLLLQFYLAVSKHSFHKCEVPLTKKYAALNAALEKVGFEKRAEEPSRMGRYKVAIWEFIKKVK